MRTSQHKIIDTAENKDPVSTILGLPAGTYNSDTIDPLAVAFDTLITNAEAGSTAASQKKREAGQKLYKLSLVLNSYDILLMKSAIAGIEREKYITMTRVGEELEMLKVLRIHSLTSPNRPFVGKTANALSCLSPGKIPTHSPTDARLRLGARSSAN